MINGVHKKEIADILEKITTKKIKMMLLLHKSNKQIIKIIKMLQYYHVM